LVQVRSAAKDKFATTPLKLTFHRCDAPPAVGPPSTNVAISWANRVVLGDVVETTGMPDTRPKVLLSSTTPGATPRTGHTAGSGITKDVAVGVCAVGAALALWHSSSDCVPPSNEVQATSGITNWLLMALTGRGGMSTAPLVALKDTSSGREKLHT
jgi:hypothetical protein